MTDHELDAKMAELCEIPQRTDEETYGAGHAPCTAPFLCGRDLFCPDPDGGCQRLSEPWNPVGDWGQVHEFVIPALRRMGLDVGIDYGPDETFVFIDVSEPCESGHWALSGGTEIPNPPPRFVCEAALEAWAKMEAASAN